MLGIIVLAACTRNQPPVITIENENPTISQGEAWNPMEGVKANDPEEGDITSKVKYSGFELEDVNYQGEYTITYTVEDSEGLTDTKYRKLTVLGEFSAPVFSGVVPSQTYYIGAGSWNPLAGITAYDEIDGNITDKIEVLSKEGIDYRLDEPGIYDVRLRVENSNEVRATVIIKLTVTRAEIPVSLPKDKEISITFWHGNGQTVQGVIDEVIVEFQNYYKALGYNFKVTQVPKGGYTALLDTTAAALNTDTHPHIVQTYPDHVVAYMASTKNGPISLNPYIYSDQWGFGEAEDEKLDDILEIYREENSSYRGQGIYYSIPFNKSTEIMYYNKTVLDLLGLQVPTTWQELVTVAQALKVYGDEQIEATVRKDNPNLTGQALENLIAQEKLKVVPVVYDSSSNFFITAARQWGGQYTSMDQTTFKGSYLWNTSAETAQAMNFFKQYKNLITSPAYWGVDYGSDVPTGYTFISIGSTAGISYNIPPQSGDQYLYELGMAPVPYNGDKADNRTVIQQGTNLTMLNKGTPEEKLVAWLFIKHLTSKENTIKLSKVTGYAPIRESAYNDPEFLRFLNNPTKGETFFSMAVNATVAQRQFFFYDPAFVGSARARTQVGAAMDRILTGDGNVTEALQEAYDKSNILG